MKKFISLVLASFMMLSAAGCNVQPKMGSGDKVLLESGTEKIKLSEYLYNLGMNKAYNEYYLSQFGYGDEDIAQYWSSDLTGQGKTMADDLKLTVLEETKDNAILLKLAKAENISHDADTIKEVEASVDNAILSFNSKEKTGERAFYEKYFVTKAEFIAAEKNMSIIENYKNKIKEAIEVTDEEISKEYEENKESYEEKTIAHILVKFPEAPSEDDKAEKMVLAEEILQKAKDGEDFGQLAAEYSEDDGSKENNGEYQVTRQTQFVQEFLSWAFDEGNQPGDMGIIETTYGYHIMKYVKDTPLEDIKESIEENMKTSKAVEEIAKILEENKMEWTLNQELFDSIVVAEPAAETPDTDEPVETPDANEPAETPDTDESAEQGEEAVNENPEENAEDENVDGEEEASLEDAETETDQDTEDTESEENQDTENTETEKEPVNP